MGKKTHTRLEYQIFIKIFYYPFGGRLKSGTDNTENGTNSVAKSTKVRNKIA